MNTVSDLVFVTGDFCSGTTLLFTLFRGTGEYHCLYEPLHENLPEYLIWPLRTYEHHFFADDYFAEYKRFRRVRELFDPRWGVRDLYLEPSAEDEQLEAYLTYLIAESRARAPKVLLKDNRFQFRLGWMRARFPSAKVVHIYRRPEAQWRSIVKRGQQAKGRQEIGQDSVDFRGFNVATWCDVLEDRSPELAASASQTGFERFSKLWRVSFEEQSRHADVSIDFSALTHEFEATCEELRSAVGCDFDLATLRHLVVADGHRRPLSGQSSRARELIDRAGRRYARARVQGWRSLRAPAGLGRSPR